MPARIILALMLGILVLPVFPQDEPLPTTEDASKLVEDYIADLMKRAEQGDASAQYLVRWYQGATEEGYRLAQYYLGNMYSKGEGPSPSESPGEPSNEYRHDRSRNSQDSRILRSSRINH